MRTVLPRRCLPGGSACQGPPRFHNLSTPLICSAEGLSIKANLRARRRRRRILWASLAVVIVAVIVVAYLVAQSFNNPYDAYIGKPVSSQLFQGLAGMNSSTLAAVGAGSAQAPSPTTGSPLASGSKPLILYVGGEFCPYCAVTRWSMIIALSKFGSFSGLEYMLSSASDTNPNSPTFTFANSTYTSQYIAFVGVEEYGRGGLSDVRQTLTANQSSLVSQYDPGGGVPFIDFANSYLINGVAGGMANLDLENMNWTQVYDQLFIPGSQTAQAIIGEANYMISTICSIDGNQPSTVCSQSFSTLALAAPTAALETAQTALAIVPASRTDLPWTA